MPDFSRELANVYRLLRGHFGYVHPWWPGSPLEIVITSVLVQQSDWTSAWTGVVRLRAGGLVALDRLAEAGDDAVRVCIHGVAFGPTKARRLVQLARSLLDRGCRDVEAFLAPAGNTAVLRDHLLGLAGIGQETADCILLFASRHAAFVVDAYTRRAFRRLNLLSGVPDAFWSAPYGRLKSFFEHHILADLSLYDAFEFAAGVPRDVALLRDYHAQLVELGKHHCLKKSPRCGTRGRPGWAGFDFCNGHCADECRQCPLLETCETGRVGIR